MQDWIINIMNQFGYWGILLLIAIENIFPPIPSEVILTFGGFMTTYTHMTIWGVIGVATAGSVLGAIILYGVGRLLSAERLEQWLNGKVGRWLRFKPGDVLMARDKFTKKGESTVLFCRCIPIVRSLISIPAGMARMPLPKFLVLTTLGSLAWNTLLVYLGAFAGASWSRIAGYVDTLTMVVAVILGAAVLVLAFIFYKKKIAKKNTQK
ncbi:MAG: DedA family protein [Clostridiaceae bacterium]|nr:DedA family protein [Clostridiaceae bacterium]